MGISVKMKGMYRTKQRRPVKALTQPVLVYMSNTRVLSGPTFPAPISARAAWGVWGLGGHLDPGADDEADSLEEGEQRDMGGPLRNQG